MLHHDILYKELTFKTTRSSGAGGQHVNKTNTRVILNWSLANSLAFTDTEKRILAKNLAKRIDLKGNLQLSSGQTRSQLRNKQLVIKRFFEIITVSLIQPKSRKLTKKTKASNHKRLAVKRIQSDKKQLRKKPEL